MASPQVIDTASRTKQLEQFFAQQSNEKRMNAESSARKAKREVLQEVQANPGTVLSHAEIARRLRKINPSLIFEQSRNFPDRGGIYVREDGANLDDLDVQQRGRRFVTGMSWGMVPENTMLVAPLDKFGEPQPRVSVKGWRLTLKNLIQRRLVSLAAVEKAFGSGGKNWHLQLN